MSLGNDVKKKILDNSDSYNFYKKGYEYYKENYEKLLEAKKESDNYKELNQKLAYKLSLFTEYSEKIDGKIDNLQNDIDLKDLDIDELTNEIDLKNLEIDGLKKHIADKDSKIQNLNNNLTSKDNELKKVSFPYANFDEYLAESHVFPLVWSPFSDESKRCFAFMEEVARYLINKVEQSDRKPLISVIMPVYNRKDVVMKAIDSVLNQTYENFELVVVDDASTDGTGELLDQINHEKVKVIHHQQNKYASGARNTGVRESSGELIAYLDSDNLLDERYLAATVGAFLQLPDAGGLYSAQYRYETYDSQPFAVQFAALNKSLLHNHNFIDMNCFAHRREIFEEIGGFDETLKGADDWELILKVSNKFKVYSVPFLLSKCYVGVVENRVSDLVPTDMGKIRSQNEVLPTKASNLDKKLTAIIPIFDSDENLDKCINRIESLNLSNLNVVISNNTSIDLSKYNSKENINVIQNRSRSGFANAVNEGLAFADFDSDILLLSKDALVTEGAIESLQRHAYSLPDCGLVVSTQVLPKGSLIQKHVPYAHGDYWCDITPSKYRKNIINVPLFHNGEILELNLAPFFCTYVKRDILNAHGNLNVDLGKHYHSLRLFSEYVRHILNLKIYHVSEAIVISNVGDNIRNGNPINEYDFKFKDNVWKDGEIGRSPKNYVWDF